MQQPSDFLTYLASLPDQGQEGTERLPSLTALSEELGVSVASLREQLEVAEAMGFVEVRPRTGIRRLPYSFFPAVQQSLAYAIQLDRSNFEAFSDLRNNIESSFWSQAVNSLNVEDHQALQTLMEQAWEKLNGHPIRIPHAEHRELHICLFRRLDNIFVQGILEAYWDAYETVGLNVFTDYAYLQTVWTYHQQMVDAICRGDYDAGYQALVEHKKLLLHRPLASQTNKDKVVPF